MKAAVLYANKDIRFSDWQDPAPGDDDVLIHVRASGVCGSDIPRVNGGAAHFYPIILGHEFSGDVVAAGKNAGNIKVGARATAAPLVPCLSCDDCQKGNYALCKHYSFIGSHENGAFAEYVAVPAKNVVVFDDSVDYIKGASFEPATVALHGILQNDMKGGETVAILGCGTIGMFTLQWVRILGARRIVVFDISDERLALAKSLGATDTVNTADPDFMKKAMAMTDGGAGFRYVFETAGMPPTMRYAFALAENGANVCFIGTPHTDLTFTPSEWENMNRKEFRLTGSWMSYSAPWPGREWKMTAHYFGTGELKMDDSMVFRKFSLSQCAEAFDMFDKGLVRGKVMFVID